MPPKRHKKFIENDFENNLLKSNNGIKRSAANINLKKTLHQSASPIPGPLNIARLNDLINGDVHLTDSDARFSKSSTSSASAGSHSSSPSSLEPSEGESSEEERLTNGTNAHSALNNTANGHSALINGHSVKNVEFFNSDSETNDTPSVKSQLLKHFASKLLNERQSLPVYKSRAKVLNHIFKNRVTVLLGETGSGKSTQLPQLIYNHGNKERIAITQPRRVAAVNLATRVAKEMGVNVGSRVGYSVRFQNKSSPTDTHIKYLTDGMLMREMMLDPNLSRYTAVIIDEAHERTVTSDILMGLLKQLMTSRPDLRIIIMSATLNAEKFSHFFDNAEIIYVEGKQYPVERYYLKESLEDVVDGAIQCVCQINMSETDGDILCFLAGQDEIDRCVDRIETIRDQLPKQAPLLVPLPLYASLPNAIQQRAFQKLKGDSARRQRKVIFATNIAETSVTIPGVKYVIDAGLRKTRVWKPALGLDTLLVTGISQASAQQRTGRAGREGPGGKCYRLYSEETYLKHMSPQTEAEIIRSNISSTVLALKNVGVDDLFAFPWLEQPSVQSISSALFNLYSLKALDDDGNITGLGRQMALLPISPHLAAILIKSAGTKIEPASKEFVNTILDIAACLSVEDLLITPRPGDRDEINANRAQFFPRGVQFGDIIMLADAYNAYQQLPSSAQRDWCKSVGINNRSMKNVTLARNQLSRYLMHILPWLQLDAQEHKTYVAPEPVLQCFLYGYKNNVALGLPDRRYRTIGPGNQMISIHPSSMVFGKRYEAIMYLEYVFTSKNYARMVSPIKEEWLED